jgi:hypothetical protein
MYFEIAECGFLWNLKKLAYDTANHNIRMMCVESASAAKRKLRGGALFSKEPTAQNNTRREGIL